VTVALATALPLESFTVTCKSPVATPPCARQNAESSNTQTGTEANFIVRNIEFSLELAKASRRQDAVLRQIADVITRWLNCIDAPVVFITNP